MKQFPEIKFSNIPGKPGYWKLDEGILIYSEFIPEGFESDGNSVWRILRPIIGQVDHPVAFFYHDWKCREARAERRNGHFWKAMKIRFEGDIIYAKLVGHTAWFTTALAGFVGVRIGSLLGIGW